MIFDSHMHSKFSTDSIMKIIDAINVAKEKNMGIIITDHMDLDYPVKDEFRFNIDDYFNEYEVYKSDKVKLGIEIGLNEKILVESEKIASNPNFDFVLGSIHTVRNFDIYSNYINQGHDKHDFFSFYFEDMLKCVQLYNNFDSLAHIDYPCRYCKFDNKEILVNDFKDILSEIFTTLISKGKVLELNTARLHIKEANNALLDVYKLYVDLGGKYVTLGSDSHIQNNIGKNFDIAFKFIEKLNLKGVYFSNRKMELF